AVASLLLKSHGEHEQHEQHMEGRSFRTRVERGLEMFFAMFNAGFDWVATRYAALVGRVTHMPRRMLSIYAVLILPTAVLCLRVARPGLSDQRDPVAKRRVARAYR